VLFVHGLTEDRRSWDTVIPLLEDRVRCIRLDLPGHGASSDAEEYGLPTMSAALASVVDEAGVDEPPLVVGHSLGAVAVSVYAMQAPVRAVVNVDQPLRVGDFARALAPLRDMLRGNGFGEAVAMVFGALGTEGVPDEIAEELHTMHAAARQEVVVGYWASVLDSDPDELTASVAAMLGQIDAPYVSIHGGDPGADYAEWLTTHLPTATVEVWGTGGHYPHLADPRRFADRVVELAR
jgi:pimeloyl-ACP methyl ester carboxylesterase